MIGTIRFLLEDKFGRRIRYPKDCDSLAIEIKKSSGERLSSSTLKRILGFFGPPSSPSLYTLDVISKYLGFFDWEDLQQNILNGSDAVLLNESVDVLRSENILSDSELEVGYSDCKLVLSCIEMGKFRLLASENLPLRSGDIMEIQVFMEKFPLYASSVIRGTRNLGPFIAARRTGIDYIRLRTPDIALNDG